MTKGIKYDNQKLRWSLLPMREIEQLVEVLHYGANKYEDDNWMYVAPKMRYIDACFRHLVTRLKGEKTDPESGLPHLIHAVACLLFLLWADNEKIDWSDG